MIDKKIIFVFGAVFLLLLTTSFSVLGTNIVTKVDDVFEIRYIDESKIEIVVTPQELDFSIIEKNQEKFASLSLDGEGYTTIVGEACLPTIRRMVEIPQSANPVIVVESVSWSYTSLEKLALPSKIIPIQPSLVKMPG